MKLWAMKKAKVAPMVKGIFWHAPGELWKIRNKIWLIILDTKGQD
jgi:hypothetical protein